MQALQAPRIFARRCLTDNSPFGDYCPAEVCAGELFSRNGRFSFNLFSLLGRCSGAARPCGKPAVREGRRAFENPIGPGQ